MIFPVGAVARLLTLGLALVFALAPATVGATARIKDVATFEGVRDNQIVGYGLVVGLNGSGDSLRNSPFTEKSIVGMLERLGVGNLEGYDLRTRNVAAVMVTATLPPFARRGSRIDVVVSSMGDSTSLRGGTLIVTPLTGADGNVYAVAQGPIAVAGFAAQGINASIVEGVPTAARIENGATVENEIAFDFDSLNSIRLALRSPDFTTALRIEEAINATLGRNRADAIDSGTVVIDAPARTDLPELMARIENLRIEPDTVAKVVIDARSGTIVVGADVQISEVAISQGGLTVIVKEDIVVSQPAPFSIGETVVVPDTIVEVQEREAQFAILEGGVPLQRLVDGLNALGVGATETISILQAIKAAGALHADLEII
ncbi:MAG: flagellar basal body P-ring protein FlgI [Pseudomonadota bacterium]